MKNTGYLTGALLALFIMAGCGQSNNTVPTATVEPSNSAPVPEVVEEATETLVPEAALEGDGAESTNDVASDLHRDRCWHLNVGLEGDKVPLMPPQTGHFRL